MENESGRRFPTNPQDYKLYEEIGEGVSATVYRALCIPLNERVAIKVLDLEKCNNDLDGIRREVQTMSLTGHPNVLRAYCSFPNDQSLWVVMPYMAGGSALHIMKNSYPDGFEEPVIATLLFQVLKALVYLHDQGHIHRDVKAGNILIDYNGAVKLGDFGVSACMFDAGDRQRARNTFVGTPCWMAPEVMQQLHGYDFKADIWSFGITALELAHGHAPFSKYPPMKVLLMTLQNAPPGLDYERDKRFSKSFKEMVAACLVKDPTKRPSSEKLLKHPFFKHARSNDYLVKTILHGLPPLGERFRTLKGKEANFLLNNKAISEDKEQLSQKEYIRGISGWNFNLEDLRNQAALMDSSDELSNSDVESNYKPKNVSSDAICQQGNFLAENVNHVGSVASMDEIQEIQDLGGPFASAFPSPPLQALKGYFDVGDDDADAAGPNLMGESKSGSVSPLQQLPQLEQRKTAKCNGESMERSISVPSKLDTSGRQKYSSGSLIPDHVLSLHRNTTGDSERDEFNQRNPYGRNRSGPLASHQTKDSRNNLAALAQEESSEGKVVQRGRFQVTSDDVAPKVSSSATRKNLLSPPRLESNAVAFLPTLQFLLQQNATQKEVLNKLIFSIEQTSETSDASMSDPLQAFREKELQAYVTNLQQSVSDLSDEVQRLKRKNNQLEQEIIALSKRDEKDVKG